MIVWAGGWWLSEQDNGLLTAIDECSPRVLIATTLYGVGAYGNAP